MYIKVLFIHS